MKWLTALLLCTTTFLAVGLSAAPMPENESAYLAGRVQENLRRLGQYALKREVDWDAKDPAAIPVMSAVWSPETYQAYLKSALPGIRKDTAEVTLKTAKTLLDPFAHVMAQLSADISSELQQRPANAELHDHAAMLITVLILREASGRFYDTRELLCRATAHLAFARYLQPAPSPSGIIARAILEAEQGHAVKALELAESLPESHAAWKPIIAMRVTGDWRTSQKSSSVLYHILYTQAFLAASNGQASQRMVDGIHLQDEHIQGRTDWFRSFLQDPPSRKFVLNKLNEALQLEGAEMTGVMTTFKLVPTSPEASIDLMNKAPGYIVSPDGVGLPKVSVLDWGTWAAHYQRHLCHNLMFVLGEQMIERKFHGLTFYPFIILQQRRQPNGLKRQIFRDALAVVHSQPQRVNAVNRMQLRSLLEQAADTAIDPFLPLSSTPYLSPENRNKPTLGFAPAVVDLEGAMVAANSWITGLPTGSYYRAEARYSLVDPAAIALIGQANPHSAFYAQKRVESASGVGIASLDGAAGPRASYDLHVMKAILERLSPNTEEYRNLLDRISKIAPSAMMLKANVLYQTGELESAAKVFDDIASANANPKLLAESALWMADYLLAKGDKERALELAETAASEGAVLQRQRYIRLLVELGRRTDAEKAAIAMQKHFPIATPLIRFYVQLGRLEGSAQGERNVSTALGEIKYRPRLLETERKAAFDAAEAIIFPGGKLKFRAMPGSPRSGLKVGKVKTEPEVSTGDILVAFNAIRLNDAYQYHFLRRETDAPEAMLTLWNSDRGYYTLKVQLKEWDDSVTLALFEEAASPLAMRYTHAEKTGKLNLSRLGLSIVPKEVFELTNIKSLDLSGNPLTSLPANIQALKSLESLDVSNCALTTLPPELGMLTNLVQLKAGENYLSSLPDALSSLKKLELLNLKENDFSAFPVVATQVQSLKYLVLSNNQITQLPAEMNKLQSLEALSLGRNGFDAFPEQLLALEKLQKLVLLDNSIRTLPDSIGRMKGLIRLDLRGNRLSDLPKALSSINGLVQLQLGNNCFTDLPESLWGQESLVELDLGGNGLTQISPAIVKLKRLKTLVISSNRLSKFPPTLPEMPALRKVEYGGNYFMPEHTLVMINLSKKVTFSGDAYE